MRKVKDVLGLTVGAVLVASWMQHPASANPAPPPTSNPTPTTPGFIVSPSSETNTNSTVNTNGATLFNASQSVFNVSGNKAEFGEQGCSFPTTLLNAAVNYGNTWSDLSSLSGINATVGVTIPINGSIANLCTQASEIRVALLKTRNQSELRKLHADSLAFCYNLRKMALDSRATVIVLPDYCPPSLAIVPTPVVQTPAPTPVTPSTNVPVQQPAPRPTKPGVKGGF